MTRAATLRADLAAIAAAVPAGARVLDVGCGDGALLAALRDDKSVDGRGIELSAANVAAAVGRGLSVVQGDADTDLGDYPSDAFDLAILSDTLQAMRAPDSVLAELLRIARRALVSLPNFGHWRVRLSLLGHGRMPVTATLPEPWFATPNIHLCTVADFRALAAARGLAVERATFLSRGRAIGAAGANWRADQAIFVLARGQAGTGRTAGTGRSRSGASPSDLVARATIAPGTTHAPSTSNIAAASMPTT